MLATNGSAAPVALPDLHTCTLSGGPGGTTDYVFRTPDVYDPARANRFLTRHMARRPSPMEFRMAALAGVAAMAAAVGDPAEGERQTAVLEDWYAAIEPLAEDDIDEPDFTARAAILAAREADRTARMTALWPQVCAIEANLERHWTPFAELKADRGFWDDVSRIDTVRLLLVSQAGTVLPRDDDGLVTQAAYRAIPPGHRGALASFALALFAPGETQRKN